MSGYTGAHWPRERQNANGPLGFGGLLPVDPAAAERVRANFAALLIDRTTSDPIDDEQWRP